ncbi:MAG: ATP-dependent Clp protease ATP-binding subunit, partial [Clostridia bacterium]|nr:ATP-dependent Clp protease ATP-binding subunit [Clostridia bacterium]
MNRFTQKAQNSLNRALSLARELGHTYIGSEHLLFAPSNEKDSASANLLSKFGVADEDIKNAIIEMTGTGSGSVGSVDMTPRTKRIIEASAYESMKRGQGYIGTEHLLLAILGERDCVAVKLLINLGAGIEELRNSIIEFLGEMNAQSSYGESDISSKDIRRQKDGARSQISGAPTLSSYGRDLTALAKEGKIDPIIGRDKETERVIQILSRRTKNNPCLIGEPGVGKTAVVEGLAQRIVEGNVPETLKGKTIVSLDIPSMIAGAKYRGEFEERLKGVMSEVAKNPSIILFIDEIHTI